LRGGCAEGRNTLRRGDLWALQESQQLRSKPEVVRALERDPEVRYFMGFEQRLVLRARSIAPFLCMTAKQDELDPLDRWSPALNELFQQWRGRARAKWNSRRVKESMLPNSHQTRRRPFWHRGYLHQGVPLKRLPREL